MLIKELGFQREMKQRMKKGGRKFGDKVKEEEEIEVKRALKMRSE